MNRLPIITSHAVASCSRAARLPRHAPSIRTVQRRYQSSQPSPSTQTSGPSATRSPSSKISSVPFALSPASAAHVLHMNALVATAKLPNLFLAALLKLFGPGVAPFAKEFGLGEGLNMRDMKAVYWPIWRVDALLEGRVDIKGKGKEGARGSIGVGEGYIPGSPFAPISYLSYAVPPLPDELPAYNPAKDLAQLGEGYDIVPVPFTVSPFAFFKKLRRAIGRRGSWDEFSVDESQWKETMVACYPIMFPIYVADFEHKREDGDRRFTVIIDAHDSNVNNCRSSWPPPPEIWETGRFTSNYYVNPAPFLPSEQFLLPMVLPADIGPPFSPSVLNDLYTKYLSPAPTSISSIPPSPLYDISGEEIPWSDLRIQSWSGTERTENDEYYEKTMSVWKGIGALEGLTQLSSQLKEGEDPKGMVINAGLNGGKASVQQKPMSEIRKQMEEDVERMKAELLGVKPSWLTEWEQQRDKEGAEGKEKQATKET